MLFHHLFQMAAAIDAAIAAIAHKKTGRVAGWWHPVGTGCVWNERSVERTWHGGFVGGRRQHGQGELRLLTGQGLQERHDLGVFVLRVLTAQLQLAHQVHSHGQGGGFAVVEVGVGQFHVAQGRHLEVQAVGVFAGHFLAALGGAGRFVGLHQAHFLERGTA